MKKLSLVFLLVIGGLTMAISAAAELSTGAGRPEAYVPGEVLVKFRTERRAAALQGYRQRRNVRALRRFRSIGVDHLELPEDMTVSQALAIFRADPDVIYAEPNHYRYAAAVPYDEHFGLLWGLHNTGQIVDGTAGTPDADIDAPEAWDVTTGSASVVVAVIDSGLDFSHPDLAGNIWINPGEVPENGLDDDGNGYVDDVRGWDFVYDDNAPAPNDNSGHGTHVAGTLAAAGSSDPAGGGEGTGVAGVSWQAQIMSLRTLDAYGAGDTADAVLAFEYANAMGADIINCSWGGAGYSQALKDAIDASSALVVCAAGNSGSDADALPHYPAAYDSPNIVSVAASDADDGLAEFSNYGSVSVDVAAPGVNIYSCAPGRRVLWTDDFDDGSIADWNSGGPNNDWGLTGAEAVSAPWSLADSPGGDYSQRTNSWIRAPVLDLSGARNARFEFKLKGQSEPGYDYLKVEVSTDGSVWLWKPIKLSGVGILNWVSGTIAGWTDALVDLSAYDGQSIFYVRFAFLSDWTNNYDGWYIDDVAVTAASDVYDGSEYRFLNGTSMAAPHVAGVAALVMAENPLISAADIKSIIAGTADPKPALDGIVANGGRVNAFGAVKAVNGGTLQFGAAGFGAAETADSATITVTRTYGSEGAVSVDYASADGTADAGSDYTAVSGTLWWDDGDSTAKTFTVPIRADPLIEGDETVTLTLDNPTGGAALGSLDTATLTIVDVPVNRAPEAVEDAASTPEDTPLTVDVLANDTDPDGDTLVIVSVSQGSYGTVTNNSGADVTYTPDPNYYGSDAFSYTISDGEKTDSAAVTITVSAVNDAPLAEAGINRTVVVGSTVSLDGGASSDPEGDALNYSWSFVAKPPDSASTLDTSDPVHPAFVPDLTGAYEVQLIVNDGFVDSAPATVTITADLDTDNDGVAQSLDNCTAVANADQRDTDNDGYGNLCDGDLNNDGSTNTLDLQRYKKAHDTQTGDPDYDPDADFDGNSLIDASDLDFYKGLHRRPPGPSCCGV